MEECWCKKLVPRDILCNQLKPGCDVKTNTKKLVRFSLPCRSFILFMYMDNPIYFRINPF